MRESVLVGRGLSTVRCNSPPRNLLCKPCEKITVVAKGNVGDVVFCVLHRLRS